MKRLCAAVLLVSGLSLASPAQAGLFDPWWLLYKVSRNSEIVYTKGPYDSRIACGGDRYSLPYGAVFLRCAQ